MAKTSTRLANPGSIANLIYVFLLTYPDVSRNEAEVRITKRWLGDARKQGLLTNQEYHTLQADLARNI